MTGSQFVVHAFAICIAVVASFTLMLFVRPSFRSAYESKNPDLQDYLLLAFFYFALPLLFTISGVGLLAASDLAVRVAIPLSPESRTGIEWTSQLGSGAFVLSIMSLCVARIFTALFYRDFSRTVFFVGQGVFLIFGVIAYIDRRYLELVVENTLEMGFLPRYGLVVLIAAVLTETLILAARRHLPNLPPS